MLKEKTDRFTGKKKNCKALLNLEITFGSGNLSAVNCLLKDYYSKVSLQICSVPVPSPRCTLQATEYFDLSL